MRPKCDFLVFMVFIVKLRKLRLPIILNTPPLSISTILWECFCRTGFPYTLVRAYRISFRQILHCPCAIINKELHVLHCWSPCWWLTHQILNSVLKSFNMSFSIIWYYFAFLVPLLKLQGFGKHQRQPEKQYNKIHVNGNSKLDLSWIYFHVILRHNLEWFYREQPYVNGISVWFMI